MYSWDDQKKNDQPKTCGSCKYSRENFTLLRCSVYSKTISANESCGDWMRRHVPSTCFGCKRPFDDCICEYY